MVVALAGAAMVSRPSPEACEMYLAKEHAGERMSERIGTFFGAHKYLCKDHYLWVGISRDGKLACIGAFGHFFKWDRQMAK